MRVLEQTIEEVNDFSFLTELSLQEFDQPNLTEIRDSIRSITEVIKTKKPKLEDVTEESPERDLTEEIDELREIYGLMEEHNTAQVDYDKLFSYLEHKNEFTDKYYEAIEEESHSEAIMSDSEAKETVQKIQLSYLTGGDSGANWEEKERFKTWQEFNKSLLILYGKLSIVQSDDVNYSLVRH